MLKCLLVPVNNSVHKQTPWDISVRLHKMLRKHGQNLSGRSKVTVNLTEYGIICFLILSCQMEMYSEG